MSCAEVLPRSVKGVALADLHRTGGEGVEDAVTEGRVVVAAKRGTGDVADHGRDRRPGFAAVRRPVENDCVGRESAGDRLIGERCVDVAVGRHVRKQVGVAVRVVRSLWQTDRLGPVGVRPVRVGVGERDEGHRGDVVEVDPHDVDAVEVRAVGIGVDGDPLLVRLVADAVVGGHEVRRAVVRGDPVGGLGRAMRMHRHGDDFGRLTRVRLLLSAEAEVVAAVGVVIELVVQQELVIVAIPVESSHRVGVVRPPFVARNVALD